MALKLMATACFILGAVSKICFKYEVTFTFLNTLKLHDLCIFLISLGIFLEICKFSIEVFGFIQLFIIKDKFGHSAKKNFKFFLVIFEPSLLLIHMKFVGLYFFLYILN